MPLLPTTAYSGFDAVLKSETEFVEILKPTDNVTDNDLNADMLLDVAIVLEERIERQQQQINLQLLQHMQHNRLEMSQQLNDLFQSHRKFLQQHFQQVLDVVQQNVNEINNLNSTFQSLQTEITAMKSILTMICNEKTVTNALKDTSQQSHTTLSTNGEKSERSGSSGDNKVDNIVPYSINRDRCIEEDKSCNFQPLSQYESCHDEFLHSIGGRDDVARLNANKSQQNAVTVQESVSKVDAVDMKSDEDIQKVENAFKNVLKVEEEKTTTAPTNVDNKKKPTTSKTSAGMNDNKKKSSARLTTKKLVKNETNPKTENPEIAAIQTNTTAAATSVASAAIVAEVSAKNHLPSPRKSQRKRK